MLGFASGVESQVFYGKPLTTDKVSNEELLDSIYAACRANPTEYAFKVVLDQELANISMLQQATRQDTGVNYEGLPKYCFVAATDGLSNALRCQNIRMNRPARVLGPVWTKSKS